MPIHPNFRGYGLSIHSELPIPGAMPIGSGNPEYEDVADLEILRGTASLSGPYTESGPYRYAPGTLLFEKPNVARYLCEGGRRMIVETAVGADDFEVSGSLIATALPALLWMRGEIMLHAAAAVLPGKACALAIGGRSGSGKSTILSQLVASGARVVGDDTLCARIARNALQISGLSASYLLGEAKRCAESARSSYPLWDTQQAASAELSAFVVLTLPRAPQGVCFRQLDGLFAFEALLKSRHRPRVPRLLHNDAAFLKKFAQLAEKIPVYAWSRREGAPTLDVDEISFLNMVSLPRCGAGHESKRGNA